MGKHHRRLDSQPRKQHQGSRPSPKSILVLSEGINSEPCYFRAVKHRFSAGLVHVDVCGHGKNDPIRLVDEALEYRKKLMAKARKREIGYRSASDYDEMWVVFDTDELSKEQWMKGVQYAETKGVKVACSNPCFEFWLLLHYADAYSTGPMVSCREVLQKLRKMGWSDYDKSKDACERWIHPLVKSGSIRIACESIQRIRKHHESVQSAHPHNPCSGVDVLIQSIDEGLPAFRKILGKKGK